MSTKTNKTAKRNQLIGALAAARESYGRDTKVCDLPDAELTTGSYLDTAFKLAGYTEAPRAVVNANNWWSLSLWELSETVLA